MSSVMTMSGMGLSTHDRSDEPIHIRSEGRIHQNYIPPFDGSHDDVRQFDNWAAGNMMKLLQDDYPGYPWETYVASKQGIVHFSIPILMGPTLKYVIRLADWTDLEPKLIRRCAGELLERLNLPRTRIDIAAFITARLNLGNADFADVKSKGSK